jgi:hypothetical protein
MLFQDLQYLSFERIPQGALCCQRTTLPCAHWSKKLLAEPLFISCAPHAIYKQINFLRMKPTTKQLKIAATLWKRRFNYPRAKRKKAKHIKGLLLPALPSECMKRENEIANYPLLWMRGEKRRAVILYTF